MKSIFIILSLTMALQGCKLDGLFSSAALLPLGYEKIATDGHSHFVYVHKEFWGDKVSQRTVGIQLCSKIFDFKNYCEVYYFASKQDIPKKFPIVNRIQPIGMFEMKEGKIKIKTLTTDEIELQKNKKVVFFKYSNSSKEDEK